MLAKMTAIPTDKARVVLLFCHSRQETKQQTKLRSELPTHLLLFILYLDTWQAETEQKSFGGHILCVSSFTVLFF